MKRLFTYAEGRFLRPRSGRELNKFANIVNAANTGEGPKTDCNFPSPAERERVEFLNEQSEFRNSGEGPKTDCNFPSPRRGETTQWQGASRAGECPKTPVTSPRPRSGRGWHVVPGEGKKKAAFTLAEVLITLGIVGVVAAMTLPDLITNVQEMIREEQVRTVKYKLTLATDKMKSLGLIGPYDSTEDFINELKNHLAIAKICSTDNLRECWPTDTINLPDTTTSKSVSDLKKGSDIVSLALSSADTDTMGIVTADGTPMILLYSPACDALLPEKTYSWSTVDNKPETNATTNCISAIFDINGTGKPNKLGTDVRTLNSLFGYKQYSATSITEDECNKYRKALGIEECYDGNDYWAGAVKKCHDIGLHLPSLQTLAVIAGSKFGRSDIDANTSIMNTGTFGYSNCEDYITYGTVICVDGSSIPIDSLSPVSSLSGRFWTNSELSASYAYARFFSSNISDWYRYGRGNSGTVPLCVGD